MFISNITDRGATPALVSTMVFNQHRLTMIAENVANMGVPGYRAKQLDAKSFQNALRRAFDERGRDPNKPFIIPDGRQFGMEKGGRLRVTPTDKPVETILSHDGTNISIERQMSQLAETRMTFELSAKLLMGRFNGLRKAIRGRP